MIDKPIDCKIGECLKQSELFDGFDKKQLAKAAEILGPKKKTYKRGDRVYRRGDTADGCWAILSGKLTVLRLQSLRRPFCQKLYHLGSVIGIQGVAHVGSIWPVTLISDEKSELVEIDQESIDKFDKDAQVIFWKNVSRIVQKKLAICLTREE